MASSSKGSPAKLVPKSDTSTGEELQALYREVGSNVEGIFADLTRERDDIMVIDQEDEEDELLRAQVQENQRLAQEMAWEKYKYGAPETHEERYEKWSALEPSDNVLIKVHSAKRKSLASSSSMTHTSMPYSCIREACKGDMQVNIPAPKTPAEVTKFVQEIPQWPLFHPSSGGGHYHYGVSQVQLSKPPSGRYTVPKDLQEALESGEPEDLARIKSFHEQWLADDWEFLSDPPEWLSVKHFAVALDHSFSNRARSTKLSIASRNLEIARAWAKGVENDDFSAVIKHGNFLQQAHPANLDPSITTDFCQSPEFVKLLEANRDLVHSIQVFSSQIFGDRTEMQGMLSDIRNCTQNTLIRLEMYHKKITDMSTEESGKLAHGTSLVSSLTNQKTNPAPSVSSVGPSASQVKPGMSIPNFLQGLKY